MKPDEQNNSGTWQQDNLDPADSPLNGAQNAQEGHPATFRAKSRGNTPT
jgi:hypothetical protein